MLIILKWFRRVFLHIYTEICYHLGYKDEVNRKYLQEESSEKKEKKKRMIISNRCFDKNTFKQNTMEIWVDYE